MPLPAMRRFALLLLASLTFVSSAPGCEGILGLPDYSLCGPAGNGGCGGSGGAAAVDDGGDGSPDGS